MRGPETANAPGARRESLAGSGHSTAARSWSGAMRRVPAAGPGAAVGIGRVWPC